MAFGHFVRILVDIDLAKDHNYKILVERVGFSFFVKIEYKRLHEFWSFYNGIGHNIDNCNKKWGNHEKQNKKRDSRSRHTSSKESDFVDAT